MDPGAELLTATALLLLGTGTFVGAATWINGTPAIATFLIGLLIILAAWTLTAHAFLRT